MEGEQWGTPKARGTWIPDCCLQLWHPCFQKAGDKLEKVQNRATKPNQGWRRARERPKELSLLGTSERKLRGDLIAGGEDLQWEKTPGTKELLNLHWGRQTKNQWLDAKSRDIQCGDKAQS